MKIRSLAYVTVLVLATAVSAHAQALVGLTECRTSVRQTKTDRFSNPAGDRLGAKMDRFRHGGRAQPDDPSRPTIPTNSTSADSLAQPPAPAAGVFGAVYVKKHDVTTRVFEGVAVTEIDQTYHNPRKQDLEGIWVCPLPEKAVLHELVLFMGRQQARGEVFELGKGTGIYNRLTRRNIDPALADLIGHDYRTLRLRVFPIPAQGDLRVKLRFAHVLGQREGRIELRYPFHTLAARGHSAVRRLNLNVAISSSWSVDQLLCDGYGIRTDRRGDHFISARFGATNFATRREFTLDYRSGYKSAGVKVHTFTEENGERFFMAVICAGEKLIGEPKIAFKGVTVIEMEPRTLPALNPGERTLLFGKYIPGETEKAEAVVYGFHRGRTSVGRFPVTFEASEDDLSFIPGLWARHRTDRLVEIMDLVTESKEIKEKLVTLAKRYGILTPHTSVLAK